MSYKKFTLKKLQQHVAISLEKQNLFTDINPINPSDWLIETLNLAQLISS